MSETLYFRVKPDTDAWKLFHQLWTQEDKWDEHKEEIEALIGCSMSKNMQLNVNELALKNVPDHLAAQFKITTDRSGSFCAKKTSKTRKAWLALAKKYELTDLNVTGLCWSLGIYNSESSRRMKTFYPPINGEYYFSGPEPNYRDRVETWEDTDWAIPVKESDFLRLHVEWLDKKEKGESDGQQDSPQAEDTEKG